MRRIILIALVAVLAFFGYMCVFKGVENDTMGIEITNLEDVKDESEKMSKELAAYDEKNEKQYEGVKASLNVAIKDYENTKAEYQDLVKTLGLDENSQTEEVVETTKKAYQIDFLFAIIGNYARAENSSQRDLDLDLVFVESKNAQAPSNAGYIFADLEFDVKGNYMKIADFIYDLEDDDRLGYEIRDFQMAEGHAVFTVYNVPIESSTLSQVEQPVGNSTTPGGSTSLPTLPITNTTSIPGTSTLTTNTTNTTNTVTSTNQTTNTATSTTGSVSNTTNTVN